MSIIHEALKKVQKTMEQNPTPQNPFTQPEEKIEVLPSTQNKTLPQKSNPLWLVLIILLLVGIAIYGLFFFQLKDDKNPKSSLTVFNYILTLKPMSFLSNNTGGATKSASNSQPASKTPVRIFVPKHPDQKVDLPPPALDHASTSTTRANSSASSGDLNIEGVMAKDSHVVALINSNIYEEGSMINGSKITKITLTAITFEKDGNVEVVSIKR